MMNDLDDKKELKFSNDPFLWVSEKLLERRSRCLRDSIKQKFDIDPQIYWTVETDGERDNYRDDPKAWQAKKQFHAYLGHYGAEKIHNWRTFVVLPILFIFSGFLFWFSSLASASSNDWAESTVFGVTITMTLILAFSTFVGSRFLSRLLLPNKLLTDEEVNSAGDLFKRAIARVHPDGTPQDLKDRWRVLDVDAEGDAVSGQVLAIDLEESSIEEEWQQYRITTLLTALAIFFPIFMETPMLSQGPFAILIALPILWVVLNMGAFWYIPVLAVLIPALFGLATLPAWVTGAAILFLLFIYELKTISPLRKREKLLDDAVKDCATDFLIDAAGKTYFKKIEEAKIEQIKNTIKDRTPFITLGRSTGVLYERRDPLAPSEAGMVFGQSVNDLSTHLGILGTTGTGKTSGVIRPVLRQWIEHDQGGLFVIDGKGALPLEVSDLSSKYKLISPEHCAFNPIQGMNPDSVADVIIAAFADKKGDSFWPDSAALLIRQAAIIIEASELNYTIPELVKFSLATTEVQIETIKTLAKEMDTRLTGAARYFLEELPSLPEKTRDSITNQVRTWLGNLTSHKELGKWLESAEGASVEDVFEGAHIGLLLPESKYGRGGILISMLVMRRLYDQAKRRGDTWKKVEGQLPCLMVADEVQNLVSDFDIDMLPISRSLGLYQVIATQNVDGLYKRLERDGARQYLGNLTSLVCLPPRTKDSNEYISMRAGQIWTAKTDQYNSLPDAQSSIDRYLHSGADKATRSTRYGRALRHNLTRVSFAAGTRFDKTTFLNSISLGEDIPHMNETPTPLVSIKPQHVISSDEIDILLAKPNTAIAMVQRGRVVRRDIIELNPEYNQEA